MARPRPQLVTGKLEKLHPTQLTVGKAMTLARSQDARYLPGWVGPIEN